MSAPDDHAGPSKKDARSPSPRSPRPPRKIACHFCRHRKLRCDSVRPVCGNCTRRSLPCSYDDAHKKRGPDRFPGQRKKKAKEHTVDGGKANGKAA